MLSRHRDNTDITYLSSVEGFLYLAAVMDLYTRRIIGWSMQEDMHTSLVVDAFNMAIQHNQHQPHFRDRLDPWLLVDESSIKAMPFGLDSFLVFHSDRGSQYASREFQHQLQENHILSSMSRKCVFRCYPTTKSGYIRPGIPLRSDHVFRSHPTG